MKKVFSFLYFLCSFTWISGQELSLDSCQSFARINHPLLRQAGIIDEISQLRQQNIQTYNLPQFDLSVRTSWQSDVTKVSLGIPGFSGPQPLAKDQYRAYLDLKQKLYDGGMAKRQHELEESDRLVSRQQIETDLYKIKEVVNTLYFNALLLQDYLRIIKLKKETLDANIKKVGSAVKNGVVLANELDQLNAEKLLTDQQETELQSSRITTLRLLEIVTGRPVEEKTVFSVPAVINIVSDSQVNRPEIELFTLQKSKLDKNAEILKISRKPYVYAFGQAGYGRPGLNMLNNNLADWYMVGAGLSWNLWDWHKTQRNMASIRLQKEIINTNLDNFNRAVAMSLSQEENNFMKIKKLISSDEQLIVIKDQIAKRSETSLENGTTTSADYLRDLNASLQAKVNLETRKVQLAQSSVNYQTIKGEWVTNKGN